MERATLPADPPAEAFELNEALAAPPQDISQGARTVLLEAIRPCVGRGKGRHVYEASMLEKNAHKLKGWKMFVNHLSEEAKRALGGLPRPLEHYGGRVLESYWDADVPADAAKGYGQGAVMAKVKPSFQVRPFLEDDPEAIQCSINARATGVSPVTRGGRRAWMVEGLEEEGSLDWVTDAGAGGRVASLLESAYHEAENDMGLLSDMTDSQFADYLRENRPELLEALTPKENRVAEPETPKVVEPIEVLREALSSYEGRELLRSITETDMREEAELIRSQASAEARREVELERMKQVAHRTITEAKLNAAFEADLLARYDIDDEGRPTPALDVIDEVDENGALVKRAPVRLAEAVAADVKRTVDLIASVDPTRVKGQGADADAEAEALRESGDEPPAEKKKGDPLWKRQLQEAGFAEPEKVYEV